MATYPIPYNKYINFATAFLNQETGMKKATIITLLLMLAVNCRSQNFDDICNNGRILVQRQDYLRAREAFNNALSTAGNDSEKVYALSLLAHSLLLGGEREDALANCNKALAIKPGNGLLLLLRANIYTALDSLECALADCNTIIAAEPANYDALYCRAMVYSHNNFDKAMEDFNTLLCMNPDDDRAKLGMVMLYQSSGKLGEALSLATILIEQKPQIAEFYIARSNVERELGQYELALLDVETAIGLQPENASHYILQAILYDNLGKTALATESRRKAEELLRWE